MPAKDKAAPAPAPLRLHLVWRQVASIPRGDSKTLDPVCHLAPAHTLHNPGTPAIHHYRPRGPAAHAHTPSNASENPAAPRVPLPVLRLKSQLHIHSPK